LKIHILKILLKKEAFAVSKFPLVLYEVPEAPSQKKRLEA
jgi:hypothetical protein